MSKTPIEVLKMALEREKEAVQYYKEYAVTAENPSVREMFQFLVEALSLPGGASRLRTRVYSWAARRPPRSSTIVPSLSQRSTGARAWSWATGASSV